MTTRVRGLMVVAALMLAVAACGGGPADGWVSIGTGDTYGEWELFAEAEDGTWTGCLRLGDEGDAPEECGDPDDTLVDFEDGFGARFGSVAEGVELEFADGDTVELLEPDGFDRSFFVVADDAEIAVRD